MTLQSMLDEPDRVQEPQAAEGYCDVLAKVVKEGKTVILRRDGADIAAVIPIEQLELVRELLARQEAERLAARIDWKKAGSRPPQEWFDDTDNPFAPE
jgi:hypothetical protein